MPYKNLAPKQEAMSLQEHETYYLSELRDHSAKNNISGGPVGNKLTSQKLPVFHKQSNHYLCGMCNHISQQK